jgi:hypothetical protein
VRLAFFREVGQQSDFQAALEHDFIGASARARRIDERCAKEVPGETGKRPASPATAILVYSFGGSRRDGAAERELLPPGITDGELMAVRVGPISTPRRHRPASRQHQPLITRDLFDDVQEVFTATNRPRYKSHLHALPTC